MKKNSKNGQTRTRVSTVTCPECHLEMYSRARHDCRVCRCGTMVDGGFDYLRMGGPASGVKPVVRTRYVKATRLELYEDWNFGQNKFGVFTGKGAN